MNACVIMSKGEIGAGGQIEVLLTSNSDGFPEFEFQAYSTYISIYYPLHLHM